MNYCSPYFRMFLLSLSCAILTSSVSHAISVPKSAKVAVAISAFVIPAISAYIASTQKEIPEIKNNDDALIKFVKWYKKVIAGKVSKKIQILQTDGELKDTYTESSGVFGKLISWYDANEKDVKKAVGLGALTAGITTGAITIKHILEWFSMSPYSEAFKKA